MSRITFSVQFYAREQKVSKKTGLCPIELSLILNGKRTFISLPVKISPNEFNKRKKPTYIVTYCETIRKLVTEIETYLISNNLPFTIETIKEHIKNGGVVQYSVNKLTEDFLKYKEERIGVEIKPITFKKYPVICKLLNDVLGNIPCDNITREDVDKLMLYLKKNYENTSAVGMLSKIQSIFNWGVHNNKIKNNPFLTQKIKRQRKEIEFLTNDEIDRLKSKPLPNTRLERVRDFVLFQLSTGLAYADAISIKKEDIQINENGVHIISKNRVKTNIPYITIVLKDGVEILKKYDYEIPSLSNQKLNTYLKELQDICNIDKNLHTHLFRKTFATMLLNAGIDIQTVAKCMGHSTSNITQRIYATLHKDTIIDRVMEHIQ